MSPTSTLHHDRNEFKTRRFWITLSLMLSTVILVWSFSLPFRQAGNPLVSSDESAQMVPQLDLTERIEQRRSSAEDFRAAAIALDKEFMRSLARKNQPKTDLPGIETSRANWNRHIESVKKQLRKLKDAEKGSVEWEERQRLLASLQDAPRE